MADTVEGLVKRDIYEVANQLQGFVGPNTDEKLAAWLIREGDEAAKLADEIVRLRAQVEVLVVERDEALTYATNFLVSFVNRYCDPVEGWAPLPDLLGVLTQLDNASTIAAVFLRRAEAAEARALAAEAQRDKLQATLFMIAHSFTEDSHGGTKTLPAHEYQNMARSTLNEIAP